MTRRFLRLVAAIVFPLFFVGLLHAEERPMKLLLESKDDGGRYTIVFPFRSKSGDKYTVKFRKEGTTEWTEKTGTEPFFQSVPEKAKYEIEAGPANITAIDCDAMPYRVGNTLLEVRSWGTVQWENLSFEGCRKMQLTATDKPDLSRVKDCSSMFQDCEMLDGSSISDWDMSNVRSLSNMFRGCKNFNQPLRWDVRNVEDMYGIFSGAKKFNQSLASWTLAKAKFFDFSGSGISDENYQATLRAWANNAETNNAVEIQALGFFYGGAKAARQKLLDEKQWTFLGDMEKVGIPNGITPFEFEIEVFDEKAVKEITIPIAGQDWSFTYTKMGGTAQTVEHAGRFPVIPVERNAKYTISVTPKGVGMCCFSLGEGFNLKKINKFGSVQWASLFGFFARGDNFVIDENAGAPDLSFPPDCSYMFQGLRNVAGLQLEKWDVSKVENLKNVLQSCEFPFDVSSWKLYKCKTIGIGDSYITPQNYDKALEAWAKDPQTNKVVYLNADKCTYSKEKQQYRDKLINDLNWKIEGDHLPHFIEITNYNAGSIQSDYFKEESVKFEIKYGGLTDEEVSNLQIAVTPTDAVEYTYRHGELMMTFKKTGRVSLKITVPEKTGVHPELSDEKTFTIKETPTLKFYVDGNLVTGEEVKLDVGSKPRFKVETVPATDWGFYWSIDNQVEYNKDSENNCWVTKPLEMGTYTVIATCAKIETLKATVKLVVEEFTKVLIEGESKVTLYLNGEDAEKTHTFKAKVVPEASVPNQDVEFAVVTPHDGSFSVTREGKVTALKTGHGKIKVTSLGDNQAIPAYCEVTVTNYVESIEIHAKNHTIQAGTPQTLTVNKGETEELSVHFTPDDVDNKDFNWRGIPTTGEITREDLPNQVTKLTFNKQGEYTLTATADAAHNPSAVLKIIVKNPATGLEIYDETKPPATNVTTQEIQMKIGDKRTFKIKLIPDDADMRDDLELVTTAATGKVNIDNTTGEIEVLSGASVGEKITITGRTAHDPKLPEVAFTISVVSEIINPMSVTTTPSGSVTYQVGDTPTFSAVVKPDGAPQTVQWIVTPDNGTLVIGSDGRAEAKKVGSVTVKARAAGIESAEIAVTINPKEQELTKIEFDNPASEVKEGTTAVFTVKFTPNDNVDKTLDVTFAPEGFLSLVSTSEGTITVKGEKSSDGQEVTITAKSRTQTTLPPATCKVKVTKTVVAVEDAVLTSIVVAPNPFSSQLIVRNNEVLAARYELVNTNGIVVRAGALLGAETVLNTVDLAAGVYLLRILSGSESKTLRVVKE